MLRMIQQQAAVSLLAKSLRVKRQKASRWGWR